MFSLKSLAASTPKVVAAAKLTILNPNEFDLLKMRIEQYFLMTYYSLWEVILNGDSSPPTRIVDGAVQIIAPTTAEQRLAKKNELKALETLLMALLDKHQLKFNIHKYAKTLMEAIEKRFRGNKETKKVQKTLLKQQYENFSGTSSESLDQIHDRLRKLISQLEILGETISQEDINFEFLRSLPSEWKTHTLIWRNKADLEEQSLDDLFNNLKIYEAEVKGSSTSSQTTQNIAFVSSNNTDSTNESVSTVPSVSVASSKATVSTLLNADSLSDAVIYSFLAKDAILPGNADHQGTTGIKTLLEELFQWRYPLQMLWCLSCDAGGGYDWSFQADEEPTNYALMAYASSGSSSSSGSDNEAPPCSKAYATLQTHYDNLTIGLEKDIKLLKLDVVLRDNAMAELKKKFKKDEKERDELKLTLDKFQTSSKYLSKLLESQVYDKTSLRFDSLVFDRQVFDCKELHSHESDNSVPISPENDRNVVPTEVLTGSRLMSLNAARPVPTAVPQSTVKSLRPVKHDGTKGNADKASANWVWKPKCPLLEHVSRLTSASMTLNKFDYTDALGRSNKELASPKQTALGNDISNPFMAGSLPKTKWHFITVVSYKLMLFGLTKVAPVNLMLLEDVIRRDLHLDDADGVECLPNEEIFAELARMGYEKPPPKLTFYKAFFSKQWKFLIHTLVQCLSAKRTTLNEFSCSMASAIICLATGRKFNFSKYIFDSMVRNVDNPSKILMYPRFLQVVMDNQVDNLTSHNTRYTSPAFTQKVFAIMRRVGKGFSGVETPLLASMMVQPQPQAAEEEKEDEIPIAPSPPLQNPTPTPHITPPTSPPHEQPTTTSESSMSLLTTLMEMCASLSRNVTKLEQDKHTQVLEILKLKKRVKKLEKKKRSKHSGIKRLRKFGSRTYWKIIRVGGITEAYHSFEDMLKGFDREDLVALWNLVKGKFCLTVPSVDKEKAL
nr:hypothetical protein [Tanacetum cinerariifolium]